MRNGRPEERWIERYYGVVDTGSPEHVADLFADRCTYLRPGYAPLSGRPAVLAFYRHERLIDHGSHRLATVLAVEGAGAAMGRFSGVLRSGALADVEFADFFRFTREGLIDWRQTFFFAPAV